MLQIQRRAGPFRIITERPARRGLEDVPDDDNDRQDMLVNIRWVLAAAASFGVAACAAQGQLKPATGWSAEETRAISAWPARKTVKPLDPALERRIAGIVAGMTLEQKIGQMTQASILSITPDEVRQYYIGSVLNGGGGWPGGKRAATVAEWAALADAYRNAAMSTDMAVKIPIIWGTDAVHGHNNVRGATTFPQNIGLGAANDADLVQRIGRSTARQVRATGIDWAFAPTLAVVQNQRWGRSYESYSSDPAIVSRLGGALVRGLQGNLTGPGDVLASAKHFAGDGGTFNGIDQGENRASARDFSALHGAGYYTALDAGAQTVMISYSSWSMGGTVPFGKMHGNRAMVTGVVKQKLGFDGIVVSDWNAIEQVPGCERDHCPQAVNAGIDLFMIPDNWKGFIAKTTADVREGRIPMSRIDDAVSRILRVKLRIGLFERTPSVDRYRGDPTVLADRALAQEAVRKSAVLLKNDKAALPLTPGKRILVVGKADSFPHQSGGWSITWQGDETDNSDYPLGETLLAGLRRVHGANNVTWSEDGSGFAPGKFEAVVVVLAEPPYAEMKGDVRWPALLSYTDRYPADAAILNRVSDQGVPVVTVLYSGRTLYATDLINRSDAFVAAFLPGTEAGALADLLAGTGRLDFTARLPFAWPNTPCPSGSEPRRDSLFARGYGLSYAKPRLAGRLTEVSGLKTCS
ncbi:MAG: glycoside hydrolase family 3 protein [Sphingomonadales bacterium]|nr:glycoside hydrolase family 3 protein [Sphingomonadales bacterium]